jgi:hypothetical protein
MRQCATMLGKSDKKLVDFYKKVRAVAGAAARVVGHWRDHAYGGPGDSHREYDIRTRSYPLRYIMCGVSPPFRAIQLRTGCG